MRNVVDQVMRRPRVRLQRAAPFLAVIAVADALALFPPPRHDDRWWLVAATVGFALVALVVVVAPSVGALWPHVVAIALFCAATAMLRESGGGSTSGYSPLFLLPVIWEAMYGTRRQLQLAIGAVLATLVIPIVLVGAPRYPASQWRHAFLLVVTGAVLGVIVQRLIQTRQHLLDHIARLATVDELTGLPNRRRWNDQVAHVRARNHPAAPLAVAMVDLDHFKRYNDLHGHPAGDALLQGLARAWRAQLRPGDFLARWGGEEFALMLTDTATEDVVEVVRRLVGAHGEDTTCSVGLATGTVAEIADLFARADERLYEAKRAGRACLATDGGIVAFTVDPPDQPEPPVQTAMPPPATSSPS